MRTLPLCLTAVALLACTATAQADLIPAGFLDLGAQGFGNAPRLLTLQTAPLEVGSTVSGVNGATTLTGDAVSGNNKSQVYSIFDLGWTSGSAVGIGFNSNNTGNSTGLLINAADLTIYNAAGTALQTFSLAAPFQMTQADLTIQQGNGNAVLNFVLDAAQQTTFDNLILANGGTAGLFEGLSSSVGCSSGSLTCEANDGADSWVDSATPNRNVVPLPSAVVLFGSAFGLGGLLLRRRRKTTSSMLA